MKRFTKALSMILVLVFCCSLTVLAESTNYNVNTPYYSYTYSSEDKVIQVPAPYVVSKTIRGEDLGIANFTTLNDVFYDSTSERFFLTDSGSNSIVVLNREYQLIKVIQTFDNQGISDCFNAPSSTCVRNGKLYVADTNNERILCFDADSFMLQAVLAKPVISVLGEDYTYKPSRLAIDLAGRIYVIATDINNGILLLDTDGTFLRFVAAPDVETTLWMKFLKSFMTKAQKENLEKAVPTEYSSICMDQRGFLYLTSSDSSVHPITKLNSQGRDILNYEEDHYPSGDASHKLKASKNIESTFVDIAVRDDDIYVALDTKKGRIFTYDQEGTLLYCFGGIGAQEGTFYSPTATEIVDGQIVITDSFYGTITVFERTEFGAAVDGATANMIAGNYEKAQEQWQNVLRLCPIYQSANTNLARIDIQNEDFEQALDKLRGTTESGYYSNAFEGKREQLLEEHFTWIIIALSVLTVGMIVWRFVKKRIRWKECLERSKLIREIRYSSYSMFHPFDGFWDIKRERRGSLAAANILVLEFIVLYALRVQFSGYLVTGVLPSEVNTLYEIVKMLLPLGLWCVANWCFTTLMDGEGTMSDIYIATAYALRPYIVTAIPLWLLSHCLAEDELFIYTTLNNVVTIWMLALIFFGMMITHDYRLSKAFLAMILSLVGICLMLFLALTFSNVVQQIYDFAMELYQEFIYRTY